MRVRRLTIAATLLGLYATVAHAQQPQPAAAVPKLVRFSGSFRPTDGTPSQTMESVTLSVYGDQTGGHVLWHEIQNVVVDSEGHYSVLMGATQNEGMPLDLFTSGEPRWLGTQFNRPGEAEQPRVLLVSVPYALKAADSDTLGGKPASAYLLAAPAVGTDAARVTGGTVSTTSTTTVVKPKATPANNGQPNYIGKFTNTTDLIDSVMYQNPANAYVGISTVTPAISLDVRTGSLPQMGIAGITDYLTFFASDQYGPAIYWDPAKDMRFGRGGTGLYNPFGFVEYLRIQSSTGNVGIGTQTPGSKLDVVGNINLSGSVLYQGSPVLQVPSGGSNIAVGVGALASNTTGSSNTASGTYALGFNTTGGANTAEGEEALSANTTGVGNTALGAQALLANTTANYNTAVGYNALEWNTTGYQNTAVGMEALLQNTTGSANAAFGQEAMQLNTSGAGNSAFGVQALASNIAGSGNVAVGAGALASNTTGNTNTAVGENALTLNSTGGNNTAVGFLAGDNVVSGSNNIHIGNQGTASDSALIRIGTIGTQTAAFVAGISGVNVGGVPVLVSSSGQLGIASSSRRYKEDIEDMGAASHDLMRLRPVTFRYKKPFADGSKPIQYGLIAEEVAEVYPDLVAHSADGQIETVKYQVLDSMLLNEVQRQQAEIGAQKDEIRRLQQRIKELDGNFQERLAKLEAASASIPGVARTSATQ